MRSGIRPDLDTWNQTPESVTRELLSMQEVAPYWMCTLHTGPSPDTSAAGARRTLPGKRPAETSSCGGASAMGKWPNGMKPPRSDAPWSRLPLAVRTIGTSGRFSMHLLLSILVQPASDSVRWWIASDSQRMTNHEDQFSRAQVAAYSELPPPDPSWIAVAKDVPVGSASRAQRVVSTVTPTGTPLYVVEYRTFLRWHSVLPASVEAELPE